MQKGLIRSLGKPLFYSLIFLLSVGSAFVLALGMTKIPIFIIGGLIGILIVYYCFVYPQFGFYIVTIIAFFVAYPDRLLKTQVPMSTGIEVLVLILFLGSYLLKKKYDQDHSGFYKTPASFAFLLYLLLALVEFFNPNMYSTAGWLFFMRRFLMFVLIYVVAYRLFDTFHKITVFMKLWIVMAFIAAAYACYQQWFGMLPFEMEYLMNNPHEYKLYFQGGTIRKFSFISDPATFGILAGAASVTVLVFAINEKVKRKRNLYWFVFFVLTIGMAFSGTRTTNIMLPAAICLYAMLTITNKKTLFTIFFSILAGVFILFGPIQNKTINRIRTTFDKKDASANVRDINRKYIQPYIYTNPLGGGILTAGVQGERFNPGHPLAGFPPDSGLLLAAIELGWIGYAITMLVYFLLLYQCVHYYFLVNNERYKVYIASITVAIFTIIVTQYSQVTIGQLPTALFFYASFSIVTRLKELDEMERTASG